MQGNVKEVIFWLSLFLLGISLGLMVGAYRIGRLEEEKEVISRKLTMVEVELNLMKMKNTAKIEKGGKK